MRSMPALAPIDMNSQILERAWFIESCDTLSWWDAQIVASAQTLGCRTRLTEDLQHGQQFDDLTVVNPLKVEPASIASD